MSPTSDVAIIVLAKAPVAGRVKTRCTPPCSDEQASALAAAALADTLEAVSSSTASRMVVALDGEPGPWLPTRFEVQAQCPGDLGQRIDHAFRTVGQPALLIGMDTPQVAISILDDALEILRSGIGDGVVGPATDGGFWAIGMGDPTADLCAGIAMSRDDTCAQLFEVIRRRGLFVGILPTLTDFDDFETAQAVSELRPDSTFAAAVARITSDLAHRVATRRC